MQYWTSRAYEKSEADNSFKFKFKQHAQFSDLSQELGSVWFIELDHNPPVDPVIPKLRPPLLILLNSDNLADYQKVLNDWQPDILLLANQKSEIDGWIEKLQIQALTRSKKRQTQKTQMDRNRELELLAGNLEKLVEQRTQWIEASNREQRDLIRSDRRFVQFLIDLSFQNSKEELLNSFLQEFRKLRLAQEIYLLHQDSDHLTLQHFKGHNFQKIQFNESWWTSREIETLGENCSRKLSSVVGRPVGKLVVFPLPAYFENLATENWALVIERGSALALGEGDFSNIKKHVQALGLTLEKNRLENHNRLSALRWEKVFDGALDPIAIITKNFEILRHNKNFSKNENPIKKCYSVLAGRNDVCPQCPLVSTELESYEIQASHRTFQVMSHKIDESSEFFLHRYVDITDVQDKRVQFIQNEKLSSIGQIAEQMAHEIYNPLAGILALVEILLADETLLATTKADLIEIQKAAVRAQKVIENLQDFVSQENEVTAITLEEIIDKTLPLLKMNWRSYKLHLDLHTQSKKIHVQPQLISQVVYNLIQNACQSMEKGKSLQLKSFLTSDSVVLEVIDQGSGIPEALQASLFKPFFTTKATGEGTGLGLSLSKQFVERFGGKLTFSSRVGQGSTFRMEIPFGS